MPFLIAEATSRALPFRSPTWPRAVPDHHERREGEVLAALHDLRERVDGNDLVLQLQAGTSIFSKGTLSKPQNLSPASRAAFRERLTGRGTGSRPDRRRRRQCLFPGAAWPPARRRPWPWPRCRRAFVLVPSPRRGRKPRTACAAARRRSAARRCGLATEHRQAWAAPVSPPPSCDAAVDPRPICCFVWTLMALLAGVPGALSPQAFPVSNLAISPRWLRPCRTFFFSTSPM